MAATEDVMRHSNNAQNRGRGPLKHQLCPAMPKLGSHTPVQLLQYVHTSIRVGAASWKKTLAMHKRACRHTQNPHTPLHRNTNAHVSLDTTPCLESKQQETTGVATIGDAW